MREVIYCKNINEAGNLYRIKVIPLIKERMDMFYYDKTHWSMCWIDAICVLMIEDKIPRITIDKYKNALFEENSKNMSATRKIIYCKNMTEADEKYHKKLYPLIYERMNRNYYREPLTHWSMGIIEAVYELVQEGILPRLVISRVN